MFQPDNFALLNVDKCREVGETFYGSIVSSDKMSQPISPSTNLPLNDLSSGTSADPTITLQTSTLIMQQPNISIPTGTIVNNNNYIPGIPTPPTTVQSSPFTTPGIQSHISQPLILQDLHKKQEQQIQRVQQQNQINPQLLLQQQQAEQLRLQEQQARIQGEQLRMQQQQQFQMNSQQTATSDQQVR